MSICTKKAWLLGIIVFLSLAMNFTLAGMMLGRGMMAPPPPPPPPHGRGWDPMQSMMERLEALPPEEREAVRGILEEYRPQFDEQAKEIKAKRKEVNNFIKSEAYEREEAQRRLIELGSEYQDMQRLAQQMMLDLADQLTPEERALVFRHDRPEALKGHRPPPPPAR